MASEADLDEQLRRDPQDIAALVGKGDLRSEAGDDRAAVAFYKAALSAAGAAGNLPMSLKPAIDRALQRIGEAEQRFLAHLERELEQAGFPAARRPPRLQHALDLMLGRAQTELQLQRPTSFYYPGLPQRRYFEPAVFPWAAAMEAAASSIREELLAELARGAGGFEPYLVSDPTRPPANPHGLRDNPAWSTLQLWEKGHPSALAEAFPRTKAAVEAVDMPQISVRAPNVLFSKLTPGARIPPHHGMLNTRLVCHLALIIPPGCGFRVGGETRHWEEGKLLIFDDTIEHEAWNEGSSDRIILIFDAWRPELGADERSAIIALFEAIDNY